MLLLLWYCRYATNEIMFSEHLILVVIKDKYFIFIFNYNINEIVDILNFPLSPICYIIDIIVIYIYIKNKPLLNWIRDSENEKYFHIFWFHWIYDCEHDSEVGKQLSYTKMLKYLFFFCRIKILNSLNSIWRLGDKNVIHFFEKNTNTYHTRCLRRMKLVWFLKNINSYFVTHNCKCRKCQLVLNLLFIIDSQLNP